MANQFFRRIELNLDQTEQRGERQVAEVAEAFPRLRAHCKLLQLDNTASDWEGGLFQATVIPLEAVDVERMQENRLSIVGCGKKCEKLDL